MRGGQRGPDQFRTPLVTHPLGLCQDLSQAGDESGPGPARLPSLPDIQTPWSRFSKDSSPCIRQQGGVGSVGELESGAHLFPPKVLKNVVLMCKLC